MADRALPHPPAQASVLNRLGAILNRLGEMLLADMLRSVEIGNLPRNLEYTAIAAGGEAESLGDEFEEAMAGFVRFAEFTRMRRAGIWALQ